MKQCESASKLYKGLTTARGYPEGEKRRQQPQLRLSKLILWRLERWNELAVETEENREKLQEQWEEMRKIWHEDALLEGMDRNDRLRVYEVLRTVLNEILHIEPSNVALYDEFESEAQRILASDLVLSKWLIVHNADAHAWKFVRRRDWGNVLPLCQALLTTDWRSSEQKLLTRARESARQCSEWLPAAFPVELYTKWNEAYKKWRVRE